MKPTGFYSNCTAERNFPVVRSMGHRRKDIVVHAVLYSYYRFCTSST